MPNGSISKVALAQTVKKLTKGLGPAFAVDFDPATRNVTVTLIATGDTLVLPQLSAMKDVSGLGLQWGNTYSTIVPFSDYSGWAASQGTDFVHRLTKVLNTAKVSITPQFVSALTARKQAFHALGAPSMKSIITELARFSKDSGGKVEYDRSEGSYFISCKGDHIAELRNDEADEFTATVKKYMREGRVDERTAQLAAAKGWIENAD